MTPLWEEPLMLVMFISIALGLAFYIYIIFFVAKFGRDRDSPEKYGEKHHIQIKIFSAVIFSLILAAVIVAAFVPMAFTITYNETYTIDKLNSSLHYSIKAVDGNRTVYTYRINVEDKPGSRVLVNITGTPECKIISRLFIGEDYELWKKDKLVDPHLLTVTNPGTSGVFNYTPVSSGDIHIVIEGECLPNSPPDVYPIHFWDVSINETREVSKNINQTLLQHWRT